MKKPQLKTQDKVNKKTQENGYRHHAATLQNTVNYNSAQHLRPNINTLESEATNKNDRNNRRPQFLRNMTKTSTPEVTVPEYYTTQPGESPQKIKLTRAKQSKDGVKPDVSQYQKLHDKLNYLQSKINDMSNNIDKKRQEKWQFLENERKERIARFERNEVRETLRKTKDVRGEEQGKGVESLRSFVTQVTEGQNYQPCNTNPYSPRHNLYYISEIIKFYKNDRSLAREHITTSAQYLKIFDTRKTPTEEEVLNRVVKLPRKGHPSDKKTVVFDLDQTLIHCNDSLQTPYDVKIKIKFPTGQEIEAGINIRPHAVQLLRSLSKNFEIIVFTASHSCYANVVLDYLDPFNQYIHHRLYRENCHLTSDGVYVKDLRIISRDLSQVLLVDNAAYSYAYQLDNAIPIIPYYKGKNDYELRALQSYIEGTLFAKDVREMNRKTFKLHKYKQFSDVDNLVKTLYGQHI